MEQHLVQSLLRPEAYDHAPRVVELKQTHISYLFITDRFVYKVKKPVDLGFLDFTTIDLRRFYCFEEVRLNRRLSPDIYLGVVEVRESGDGAAFTGDGSVIDYAVMMRRLPEEQMLDQLLAAGKVDGETMRRVARRVADFHSNAERNTEIDQNGSLAIISRNWEENFAQVSSFVGETINAQDLAFIKSMVNRYMAEQAHLFDYRISQGFIRDCDGDLHLENICLGNDVWIFDCIEFNSRFRYIDTASDIAFLLMDLEYHDRSDLASLFLDEYCSVTGDEGCRPLLEFYKVYRAFVRGKVASIQLRDMDIPASQREVARERSRAYFRLARGYLLRHQLQPTLILVGGLMGSGKSMLARLLGRELGVLVLSSDRIRKELFSVSPLPADGYSCGIYTPEADTATYAALLTRAVTLVGEGKSVIVDATFRRAADRLHFREAAGEEGVGHCMVMTDAPEEVIRMRLAERKNQPDEVSDGRLELFDRHRDTFEYPDPSIEQSVIAPTGVSPWAGVEAVISALGIMS